MSDASLGRAAAKILQGEVDGERIAGLIASCSWCQEPRMNYSCWHSAAVLLLDNGLRARHQPAADLLTLVDEADA